MIITIITNDNYFWNWLGNSDTYKNNFSYEGAKALQAYMDEYGDDVLDGYVEFDGVAWCCEYSEYDTITDCANQYGYEEVVDLEKHGNLDLLEVEKLAQAQALEWLENNTDIIRVDNGHIIVRDY